MSKYSRHQKKVYTCPKANYLKSGLTRGKVGGASYLLFIWPPAFLSTLLAKCVYFFLWETVRIPHSKYKMSGLNMMWCMS